MNKLEQVKAMKSGKGLQYLLDAARMIFHNPILMFEIDDHLIAFTDDDVDDPIWNELISTGTFSMKTLEFFAKEYFSECIANADKVAVVRSPELKYGIMAGHIFNRENVKVGIVAMYEYWASFDEDTLAAFELFSAKITNEIRHDEHFIELGRAFHEDMINRLLDRNIRNPLVYTPHLQILYDGFDDYLYVAVVDVSRNVSRQNGLEYFKQLLMAKNRSYKYAVYSGYIVMVMSSRYKSFYEELFFEEYHGLFKKNNLYAGVSGSFENLHELREHYGRAVAALKNESIDVQRVFKYDAPPHDLHRRAFLANIMQNAANARGAGAVGIPA